MELALSSNVNVPKMSSSSLEVKNNFYVIKTGLLFNYFPIKVEETPPEANIIRFEKTPPVIIEGVAIISKKLYRVTAQDLLRGVIRKSREIAIAKREDVNGTTKSKSTTRTNSNGDGNPAIAEGIAGDVTVSEALQYRNKQGIGTEAEMEISKAADVAWEEQVGALLDFISAKEGIEWETEDFAQS